MTDLEMTKLCAEAIGVSGIITLDCMSSDPTKHYVYIETDGQHPSYIYHPLHDDAQAMALVKKFQLVIERDPQRSDYFGVTLFPARIDGKMQKTLVVRHAPDLNRAIVECVAKMKASHEA